MRRILYIILVGFGIIMSVSCNHSVWEDDVTIPSDEISFAVPTVKVNVSETSRVITTETLAKTSLTDGDAFVVWGYCVPYAPGTTNLSYNSAVGAWNTKRALSAPHIFHTTDTNFFNTVTVGGPQTGATSRLWYKPGKDITGNNNTGIGFDAANYLYTFFAYYPAGDNGFRINPSSSGNNQYINDDQLIVRYSMPYENNSNINLNNPSSYLTNDAMLASVEDHKPADGKVAFTFQHLLTGLSFQVNNFTEYTDEYGNQQGKNLIVKDISLSGTFHKTIDIDLFSNTTATYTNTYSATTYTIFSGEQTIPYDQNISQVLGNPLLLLSGNSTSGVLGPDKNSISLTVVYQYENENEETTEVSLLTDDSFIPKAGTHYTIQLNWIGDKFVILLPTSEESWGDGENDDNNADNDDIIFE